MTQKLLIDLLEQIKNQLVTPDAPTALQGQWLDQLQQIADNWLADTAAPGVVRLATNTEAAAGTLTDAAVTPAGLAAAIASVVGVLPASTTVAGSVELATSAETITGTDTERAVTPAGLAALTTTSSRSGLVELATNAETITGTDTARAVTPAGFAAGFAAGLAAAILVMADTTFVLGAGPIIRSADNTKYRIVTSNAGVLSTEVVA